MELKHRILISRPCYDTYVYENIVSVESMRMEANKKGFGCTFHFTKGSNISQLREQSVRIAKSMKADYILSVDSDMYVGTDSLARLLIDDVDIVSGVYVSKQPPFKPVMAKKIDGKYEPIESVPKSGLMEVDLVGFGFMLVKMSVFDKIKPPYFQMTEERGEDSFFCEKAIEAGFKINVDAKCRIGHTGQYVYTYDDYEMFNGVDKPELVDVRGARIN